MTNPTLRIGYVDMNNGMANQATRCFKRHIDSLQARVLAKNPGLRFELGHVQPRNLGETPDRDWDLVLSSGGPGSPYDGYDEPWCTAYRAYLDYVIEQNQLAPARAPQVLAVCHSFEVATVHFGVAQVCLRPSGRKFGVMPAYVTPEGAEVCAFKPFADRLFVWEHRFWEAVHLDARKLEAMGGRLLARESRPGREDKGQALLAFEYSPGLLATQFHPEADRQGLMVWVYNPEHAGAFKKAYGEELYQRMLKTLEDPSRVARTFALFVPSWLTDRFNAWARSRGLAEIDPPEQDLSEFFAAKAANG